MESILFRTRWDAPRDHVREFAVYSHGLAERMSAGPVVQDQAIDEWLWVCFHDSARVWTPSGGIGVPPFGIMVWRPSEYRNYGREDAEWTHTWIQMSGTRVEKILETVGLIPGRVWQGADAVEMERMWRFIHGEAVRINPDDRILGNELENGLRRMERRRRESPAPAEARLEAVRAWLEVETVRRISLPEMARRAGMSRSHFSARFQERFGEPPGDFHLQRRMETARFLMVKRGLRVEEAGAAVGYPDPASFSRMFKRVVGVAPRKAREKGWMDGRMK